MIVFQDNLGAHRSKLAKEAFNELDIKPVWNVPYSPQYNCGIERLWGQIKTKFRPKLLEYMLTAKAKDKPLKKAVREVMEQADQASIPLFIDAARRNLREDAKLARIDL